MPLRKSDLANLFDIANRGESTIATDDERFDVLARPWESVPADLCEGDWLVERALGEGRLAFGRTLDAESARELAGRMLGSNQVLLRAESHRATTWGEDDDPPFHPPPIPGVNPPIPPPPPLPPPPPRPQPQTKPAKKKPASKNPRLTAPARSKDKAKAPSGQAFIKQVFSLEGEAREKLIVAQILSGNIPDFLRELVPITVTRKAKPGRPAVTIKFFVTRDVLAIGKDSDYVLMPMGDPSSKTIAKAFGCVLPTGRMVELIYKHADHHLPRETRRYFEEQDPAKNKQKSTEAYEEHDSALKGHRRAIETRLHRSILHDLVAGHKKIVVMPAAPRAGVLATYGWFNNKGIPTHVAKGADNKTLIRGAPYFAHARTYADYSHGTRLVWKDALVDGKSRPVIDILRDKSLFSLLGLSRFPKPKPKPKPKP